MLYDLRYGLGWWLAFLLLYPLLAGSLSWQELVAGAVLSGAAALAVIATRRAGQLHFQPRWRWLGHFRRLPGRLVMDCVIVGAALARALLRRQKREGTFRSIPFDPGSDDAESAARRALAIAGACLTPNSYVVAVDAEKGQLLMHQLVPSAQPPGEGDRKWPL
ncbi:MAG TPA: Na+/H+ antiporter subunit E [Gemmataceae bacterium]|nr:Na+/H+ antiporter subunit E [Gemmataceae bacterium]